MLHLLFEFGRKLLFQNSRMASCHRKLGAIIPLLAVIILPRTSLRVLCTFASLFCTGLFTLSILRHLYPYIAANINWAFGVLEAQVHNLCKFLRDNGWDTRQDAD